MEIVLPWSIWEDAQPRKYPYGFSGLLFALIISIVYLITLLIIGLLFREASKELKNPQLKYWSYGFLVVFTFDVLHVIGDVLFYLTNDSRVPISFDSVVFYYYPTATSLSVAGIIVFYMLVFYYSILQIHKKLIFSDKIIIFLDVIGILIGLSPYNWWHMTPPEGVIDTKPITGMFLLILGIIAVFAFFKYLRNVVKPKAKEDKLKAIQFKFLRIGFVFMIALTLLMVLHGIMARFKVPWAATGLLIITFFKLLSMILTAIFVWIGFCTPRFIIRKYVKT